MRIRLPQLLVLLFLLAGGWSAHAQGLSRQPIPFSVWLDFDALSAPNPPAVALPIWLESVQAERPATKAGAEEQTTFRIRFRHMGALSREVELRLFFEDLPGISPVVTGWTETGLMRWTSGALGSGLGLSTSETLIVPAGTLDYLDVTVPGHGSTIRGVFLSSVTLTETRLSLDFPGAPAFADPFGGVTKQAAPAAQDAYLLGRVRALLEAGPFRLTTLAPASWDLQIDDAPEIAVLTFELLNADLSSPPELAVNGQALGPVTLQLPDLADPAFRGRRGPPQTDPAFHYAGWIRAQKVLPASALKKGVNEMDLVIGPKTEAVAIRTVELQLKYSGTETPPAH